jgi:DNA end-binding protein Ku
MVLTTMVHADEIVPIDTFGVDEIETSVRELKMARLLVESMTGAFEPGLYTDEHRARLLSAIAAKAPEAEAQTVASAPSPTRVMDLMAALGASVKAAKAARRDAQNPKTERARRRSGSAPDRSHL